MHSIVIDGNTNIEKKQDNLIKGTYNSDLDNCRTVGIYTVSAGNLANQPIASGGFLIVFSNNAQLFVTASNGIYMRCYWSNKWGKWYTVST